MSDDFVALALDESVSAFKDVLQGARLVDRKPGAHQSKYDNEKQKYQKLHRHGIRDGRVRILGFNVKRPQQPGNWAGEEVIQECR